MTDHSSEPLLVNDSSSPNHRSANDSLLLYVRDSITIGEKLSSSEIVKRAIGAGRCRRALDAHKVKSILSRCPYVRMIPKGAKTEGKRMTTKVALWERVEYVTPEE